MKGFAQSLVRFWLLRGDYIQGGRFVPGELGWQHQKYRFAQSKCSLQEVCTEKEKDNLIPCLHIIATYRQWQWFKENLAANVHIGSKIQGFES